MKNDRDLEIYKKLIENLADYISVFYNSGIEDLYDCILSDGIKTVPSDKIAQDILLYILDSEKSLPVKIQELVNLKFSDLPLNLRPVYLDSGNMKVAFWKHQNEISDKVLFLLKGDGVWSNKIGEEVQLLNNSELSIIR